MTHLTLEERFERVEGNLIGIWRFRQRGQQVKWCATYVYGGYYYDVEGKSTVDEALNAVHRNLTAMKKRRKSKKTEMLNCRE